MVAVRSGPTVTKPSGTANEAEVPSEKNSVTVWLVTASSAEGAGSDSKKIASATADTSSVLAFAAE